MKTASFTRHLPSFVRAGITAGLVSLIPSLVVAQPAIFKGADLAQGRELMDQANCKQCHVNKVGGDGSAIYKPTGKINNPGLLRGMVEQCNTALNLQMFPDEVTNVAALLNRDHYKFK